MALPIAAAPIAKMFLDAVGLSIVGLAAKDMVDVANKYIEANPDESIKILSTLVPNIGIGQIFMSKEDKISLEDLDEMTDEEAQDLTKEEKAELMKQAGKSGGPNKRQTMIDISEKLGLSGEGKEKQDIEYDIDERYDEGGVEEVSKPKFDYTKFFRKRRADGGAIGVESLFEEKVPAAPSQLVEESEIVLGYRGPGGYQGGRSSRSSRSGPSRGPAGGASAGGNYGGNRNPGQTYGGSIFRGGGGGPKPGTGSTGPAGGATRRITPTVSQTPNFGLTALEFAKKYNPLNFLFGTPVGAAEMTQKELIEMGAMKPGIVYGYNLTDQGKALEDFRKSAVNFKKAEQNTANTPQAALDFMTARPGLFGDIIENKEFIQSAIDKGFLADEKDYGLQKPLDEYLADGGRVGFDLGGLTGPAKSIYDSMMAAGYFTEDEIRNAIIGAGYEIPGASQPEQVTGIINQQLQTGGGDNDGQTGFGKFGNLDPTTEKEVTVNFYDEEYGDFVPTKTKVYQNTKSGLYQTIDGKNAFPAFSNKGQAFGLFGLAAQALGGKPDTVGGYVPGSIQGKYDGIGDMFSNIKNPFNIFKKQQATLADINAMNQKAIKDMQAKKAAEEAAKEAAIAAEMAKYNITSGSDFGGGVPGGGGGNVRTSGGDVYGGAAYGYNEAAEKTDYYRDGGLATMFKEKR
jgi:hypothetical protein